MKQLLKIALAEHAIDFDENFDFNENIKVSTENDVFSHEIDSESLIVKDLNIDIYNSNLDTYLVDKIPCVIFKDKNEIN